MLTKVLDYLRDTRKLILNSQKKHKKNTPQQRSRKFLVIFLSLPLSNTSWSHPFSSTLSWSDFGSTRRDSTESVGFSFLLMSYLYWSSEFTSWAHSMLLLCGIIFLEMKTSLFWDLHMNVLLDSPSSQSLLHSLTSSPKSLLIEII